MISEVFNEDCMVGMARYPDKFFDLAIVDPPYGINYSATFDQRSCNPMPGRKARIKRGNYNRKDWDSATPDDQYFKELFRVSKNQIIWGGNYFDLPPTKGIIVWDKNNDLPTYADGELAWTSFNKPLKIFYFMWNGFKQAQFVGRNAPVQGNHTIKEKRMHPTQKPIKLYEWVLETYAKPSDKILDTHMGSQSSRIAAHLMGFDYYGWEIDAEYFEKGNKRFKEVTAQQQLFRA